MLPQERLKKTLATMASVQARLPGQAQQMQDTEKFVREQEEPGGAALCISKGLAMISIPLPLQLGASFNAKAVSSS